MSPYKYNFILKGGFLISTIVGLDTRTTMDLDTTIKGFTLTHESIREIFSQICAIEVEDDVIFSIIGITDIRETDDYPGIRVSLKAEYNPISVPLTVDVTTGDVITPKEIEYTFKLLFDDRTLSVLAYNIETVLAEKIETVLSRGIANTRLRDFYDIHIIYVLQGKNCDDKILKQALEQTIEKRGSNHVLGNYPYIIEEVKNDEQMQTLWKKYQKNFDYAKDISFDDVCNSLSRIVNRLFLQ